MRLTTDYMLPKRKGSGLEYITIETIQNQTQRENRLEADQHLRESIKHSNYVKLECHKGKRGGEKRKKKRKKEPNTSKNINKT